MDVQLFIKTLLFSSFQEGICNKKNEKKKLRKKIFFCIFLDWKIPKKEKWQKAKIKLTWWIFTGLDSTDLPPDQDGKVIYLAPTHV